MVTLLLGGDVMLGRGIDQVLAHPVDPHLRERHVTDARTYVELAERVHGATPRPAEPTWPWGDGLGVVERLAPDVRVLNLETSITRSDDFAPGKGVHYRMDPGNVEAVAAARPDVCTLANNHVLDFGTAGLEETLDVLADAGIRTAGAGRDRTEARRPAVVDLPSGRRVLVFAFGAPSSGIPADWAAGDDRPGVELVQLSDDDAADVVDRVQRLRRPGDLVVASVHWGSNWGYEVDPAQARFARALVDGGVDVVHGHSSHHPRPIEAYRGRLILHGCGDLVNDYEGIGGHERYRGDLRLLYLASLEAATGRLTELRMVALQSRRLRLEHASSGDADWLAETLDRASRPFGTHVVREADGTLVLAHGADHP